MNATMEHLWPVCLKLFEEGITPEIEPHIAAGFRYTDPLVGGGDARTYASHLAAMEPLFSDWEMRDEGHAWHGNEVFARIPFSCRVAETGKWWTVDEMVRVVFDDEGKITQLVGYYDPTPLLESVPDLGGAVTQAKKRFSG